MLAVALRSKLCHRRVFVSLPVVHSRYRSCSEKYRSMASVAPSAVQSTADAATNPAILKAQEATSAPKKSKEKKGKPVSAHPLEVLVHTHFSCLVKSLLTSVKMNPPPDFFDHRIKIFERLQAEYNEWVASEFICKELQKLHSQATSVQSSLVKKYQSLYLMVLNGKELAGRRLRWISLKSFLKA